MPSKPNIAILIVAAGASTRFGRPKQLLPWRNSTLIGHAINSAIALQKAHIYVVLGANYRLIKPEIAASGVHILNNENWQEGLGSSIAVGAKYLLENATDLNGVFVMLGDQPLISVAYLEAMHTEFGKGAHKIIATSYGDKKYGVPTIFDVSFFAELTKLCDDKGAKGLINQNLDTVTAVDLKPILTDIDTQEDYENLRKTSRQS
ncbi:MAG: nucleotidyltransferase family protein [Gilvibacter sp.]